jgi:hypothetical protein
MGTKLHAQWVVGFVDGEGCFHIEHNGKYFLPSFTVVQHSSNVQILYALKEMFGVGVVRKNTKTCMCWRVRSQNHLLNVIIPFFNKHPLKTSKNVDFKKFAYALTLMQRKEHLTPEGAEKILRLKVSMNKKNLDHEKIESDLT